METHIKRVSNKLPPRQHASNPALSRTRSWRWDGTGGKERQGAGLGCRRGTLRVVLRVGREGGKRKRVAMQSKVDKVGMWGTSRNLNECRGIGEGRTDRGRREWEMRAQRTPERRGRGGGRKEGRGRVLLSYITGLDRQAASLCLSVQQDELACSQHYQTHAKVWAVCREPDRYKSRYIAYYCLLEVGMAYVPPFSFVVQYLYNHQPSISQSNNIVTITSLFIERLNLLPLSFFKPLKNTINCITLRSFQL